MDYLLKASVIIAIFYACYCIFLQRETFFVSNRWFLILGLVTAVLFPMLVIPIYVEATPSITTGFGAFDTTIQNTPEAFDVTPLLIWIYGIGMSFFSARLIIQFFSLATLIKKNDQKKSGHFTYVETNQVTTPFSFFKWIVYNPKQFDQGEIELILQHEKVHAKQMHSIDVLVMDVMTALFWFNPFIWLYRKALKQNLEFIADHHTQEHSDCEERYQKLLLKASLPQQNLMLINTFYNSTIRLKISGKQIVLFNSFGQVKKRILMLHKSKSTFMNTWKYSIVVPLLVVFALTFNTETIAQTADQVSETLVEDQHSILNFVVTKDSKDNELDVIKDKLAEKGATLTFKNVKRNSKKEITSIKINYQNKGTKGSYHSKLSEPISPIEMSFNLSTNAIYLGKQTSKSNKLSDAYFTVDGLKVTSSQLTSGKTELNTDDSITALIIVDGKEIKKEEMDAIDPNSILSISVLKDANATNKYGKKGENGVIIITMKKDSLKTTTYKGERLPLIILGEKDINDDQINASDKNPIESTSGLKREATTKESGQNDLIVLGSRNEKAFSLDGDSPLIIVDGKEINRTQIEALNPHTIASMDILKDESATKQYGEKGKNGVIIITLKKD